jgi:hypothetical protein
MDRIAKTRQREASELSCKSDERVDGVVGIVASVSPELVVGDWIQCTGSKRRIGPRSRADSGRPGAFSGARSRLRDPVAGSRAGGRRVPRSPSMDSVLLIHRSERQRLGDSVIRAQPRTPVAADTVFRLGREAGWLWLAWDRPLSCSVIALSGRLIASAYPFEASEQKLRLRSRRSRDRDRWDKTEPYPCRWRARRHRGSAPEAHFSGQRIGRSARS